METNVAYRREPGETLDILLPGDAAPGMQIVLALCPINVPSAATPPVHI